MYDYGPSKMRSGSGSISEMPEKPHFGRSISNKCLKGRPFFVFIATSLLAFLYLFGSLSALWSCSSAVAADALPSSAPSDLVKHSLTAETPLLEVLQVYPPVLTVDTSGYLEITDGSNSTALQIGIDQQSQCLQTLVVHSFAYSYGQPYVGSYEPPSCDFNRITWNLTVISAGRQFDRLGIVYLGDVEVFRTSTAEPTTTGIEWVYLKDMTPYLALFQSPQRLIFDLGNLINDIYTGAFNVTLTATYFTTTNSTNTADIILPVSTRQSSEDAASVFTFPDQNATTDLTFPRNTLRAVFTIAATGQSAEEFWWSNVLSSNTDTFPQTGTFYGGSPFREVQLYIDNMLAGVVWPFPVIFTGGVVPGLWRPIVGIDTFDLREDEIDITAFLPILCDGNSHTFTIRVSGLSDGNNGTVLSETTGEYWLVTGKAFLWLDLANHTTYGTISTQYTPLPQFTTVSSVGTSPNGTNETLNYRVTAHRELSLLSSIFTSQGVKNITWQQSLSFSNTGSLTDAGNVQINQQTTTGVDISSSGYSRRFDYPLWAKTGYSTFEDNYTIVAEVRRGKDLQTLGETVFPTGLESFYLLENLPTFNGAALTTTQNGSATYTANTTSSTSFSFGSTEQELDLAGLKTANSATVSGHPNVYDRVELYHRHISAANSSIIEDDVTLVDTVMPQIHTNLDLDGSFAAPGIKAMIGRGPNGAGQN